MKRVEKDILFILISGFILTLLWIGFNLHHRWVTTTISEDMQLQIAPIAPNFDLATLEKLKKRDKVAPILDTVKPSVTPTAAPEIAIPTPEIVPSPIPTLEPTPTPEPTLAAEPTIDQTGGIITP